MLCGLRHLPPSLGLIKIRYHPAHPPSPIITTSLQAGGAGLLALIHKTWFISIAFLDLIE